MRLLEQLRNGEFGIVLKPLDYHFARQISCYGEHDPESLAIAAVLLTRALREGHSCVDLDGQRDDELLQMTGVDAQGLACRLRLESAVCGDGDGPTPLVLSGERLYLHRYWRYEQTLAARIECMAATEMPMPVPLAARLRALFADSAQQPDWQQLAIAMALTRQLAIISGGPGTGKTTTVARLLLLLAEAAGDERLQFGLAAPTGKAAARLSESLGAQFTLLGQSGLCDPGLLERLPRHATTLHRLLGARQDMSRFRFDATNPLPLDLLVVDESSMIDLRMMHALFQALPPSCRLLLVGDHQQLASVEAGNVFGEICRDAGRLSSARCTMLQEICGVELDADAGATSLSDTIAALRYSYRFAAGGGIARLAGAVKAGDQAEVAACLTEREEELEILASDDEGSKLASRAADGYQPYLEAILQGDIASALLLRGGFQVLCALRASNYGAEGLNQAIETELARRGLLSAASRHYVGRPVLLRRNDAGLGLFNGDLGLVLADAAGQLQACFAHADGSVRRIAVSRLPAHETAYAMTVHKSQGSEFEQVLLVLPAPGLPGIENLLRRELLYTGISRARTRLTVALPKSGLPAAWLEPTRRHSGLAARIDLLSTAQLFDQ